MHLLSPSQAEGMGVNNAAIIPYTSHTAHPHILGRLFDGYLRFHRVCGIFPNYFWLGIAADPSSNDVLVCHNRNSSEDVNLQVCYESYAMHVILSQVIAGPMVKGDLNHDSIVMSPPEQLVQVSNRP